MLGAGYTPIECNREIAKDNWHFSYMRGGSGLCVEAHWSLIESLYPFHVDTDGLWQRSRPAVIAGTKAFVLSPEDLLLHLCLHNAKHVFELGIKHICDISETLRHYGEEMDWNSVKGSTEQWGIERCVYVNLRLVKELLGAVVPDWLLDELKPAGLHEEFLTQAEQQIFGHGEETHQTTDGLSLWVNVAQLWQKKGFLKKLFYFVRRIFRAREEMARMYPVASDSTRIYLYYPVRIRDLVVKHGRQAWRLWRGDKEMKILLKAEQDLAPLKEWLMSS